MVDYSNIQPRLLSGAEAAAYCGVTAATFSKWVAANLMPKPVIGRRWDRKAIDLMLDRLSGIEAPTAPREEESLEQWMQGEAARQALVAEAEWERKYEARNKR